MSNYFVYSFLFPFSPNPPLLLMSSCAFFIFLMVFHGIQEYGVFDIIVIIVIIIAFTCLP